MKEATEIVIEKTLFGLVIGLVLGFVNLFVFGMIGHIFVIIFLLLPHFLLGYLFDIDTLHILFGCGGEDCIGYMIWAGSILLVIISTIWGYVEGRSAKKKVSKQKIKKNFLNDYFCKR